MITKEQIAFIIFFLCGSIYVFGGGFQVNLQDTRAVGMGHCGVANSGLGAASVFFNPGLFAFQDSNEIRFSGNVVWPTVDYLAQDNMSYMSGIVKQPGTPFAFYAGFSSDSLPQLSYGVAVYTPFGSGIKYPDDWLGQFLIREMSLKTIFVQPTIGFQVSEFFGFGLGFVYGTGNFLLRKGIPLQDVNGNYGEAILTGTGGGTGFNVGINFIPNEKWMIGASYRSGVSVNVKEGKSSFTTVPYLADSFPDGMFTTNLRLPDVVNLGLQYQLSESTQFNAEVNYIGWSSYDTLAFDFDVNTSLLADVNSPREWKNSFIFRGGFAYEINQKLEVRAGTYYDLSPVQDNYLTPETPDSDKFGMTTGIGYETSFGLGVQAAFLYVNGKKRTAINQETGFGGTWKTSALIPSFGLNYSF